MQQDWESAFVYCLSKYLGSPLAHRIQHFPKSQLNPYEQKIAQALDNVQAQLDSLWQQAWASGVPDTWRTWEPKLRSSTAVLVDTNRALQHRQRSEWRLFYACVVGPDETSSAYVAPSTALCWQFLADWQSIPYRIEVLAHDCALKDPKGQRVIEGITEFNRSLYPRIQLHQKLMPHWGKFVNARSRSTHL